MKLLVLLSVFFFIFNQNLFSQEIKNEYECIQYEKIIKELKTDKEYKEYFNVRKLRLNIYDSIYICGIDEYLLADYYAYKWGITKTDFFSLPGDSIGKYYKLAEKRNTSIEMYQNECVSLLNDYRPNVSVIFSRIDTNTIQVGLEKIYRKPRHSFGLLLIVVFNNETDIEKIIKTSWTE